MIKYLTSKVYFAPLCANLICNAVAFFCFVFFGDLTLFYSHLIMSLTGGRDTRRDCFVQKKSHITWEWFSHEPTGSPALTQKFDNPHRHTSSHHHHLWLGFQVLENQITQRKPDFELGQLRIWFAETDFGAGGSHRYTRHGPSQTLQNTHSVFDKGTIREQSGLPGKRNYYRIWMRGPFLHRLYFNWPLKRIQV